MSNNSLQLAITVQRTRRNFGAPIEFKDRNVADAKDSYMQCDSYEDRTFDLKRMELTTGTQVNYSPPIPLSICYKYHSVKSKANCEDT